MTQQQVQRWAEPIYDIARRPGPEADLEDAVVAALPTLLSSGGRPSCIFGSRTIGAGAPDLTVVYCATDVSILAESHPAIIEILAYLRVVDQARSDTLRDQLRLQQHVLDSCLHDLFHIGALQDDNDSLTLSGAFRQPLKEVVTIEVKVAKWRDAVSQAARNRTFANRSLIALPESQARLATEDPRVTMLGIGVISIDGSHAKIIRRARRSQPRVWRYYFELTLASAHHLRLHDAVYDLDGSGED